MNTDTKSPWYPHTINCIRKSLSRTNPQACTCDGNEFLMHCDARNLDPNDPESMEIYKNFIIDHGGDL